MRVKNKSRKREEEDRYKRISRNIVRGSTFRHIWVLGLAYRVLCISPSPPAVLWRPRRSLAINVLTSSPLPSLNSPPIQPFMEPPTIYPLIHLSTYPSPIHPPNHPPIHPPTHPPIHPSIHSPIQLPIYPTIYLSTHPSTHL